MSLSEGSSDVRFVGVSLDCADPTGLGEPYLQLPGGCAARVWSRPSSVGVQVPGLLLALQRMENYCPSDWPGASIVHLDLTAAEHLDEPVRRAVALGAWVAESRPVPRWKVLMDPGGHPFCITTVTRPTKILATSAR